MLRMIRGELRKLLTRRIAFLLMGLLVVNAVMSVLYYKEQSRLYYTHDYFGQHKELILTIERIRAENPEEIDAYHARLTAEYKEQYAVWEEEHRNPFGNGYWGEDPVPEETQDPESTQTPEDSESTESAWRPSRPRPQPVEQFEFIAPYTYSDEWNDLSALDIYFNALNNYPEILQKTIDEAKGNSSLLGALGITPAGKTNTYQEQMADIYRDLLEKTEPTARLTLGWDDWFGYSSGMLVLFLACLVLVLQSGLCDRDSGMDSILRVSKLGRWQRGLAKSAAFFILLTALVLLMRICDLAIFAGYSGLTTPFRAIQNVRIMTYCPFAISIATGALLNLAGLILSAFCFSMVCLICTAILRNAFVSVIVGGGLMAGNLVLYWVNLGSNYQFLGMFSLASGDLLKRCPDIAKIHLGKSLYPYSIGFYLILTVLLTALFLFFAGFMRPNTAVGRRRIALFEKKEKVKERTVKVREKPTVGKRSAPFRPIGLLRGEFVKLTHVVTILLVLILIALHGVQNVQTIRAGRSDGEATVRELISTYGDRVTKESLEQMQERLAKDEAFIAGELLGQYNSDYFSGKITSEEYYDFLTSKAQAQAEISVLSNLTAHSAYLLDLEEQGIKTELFYDGGYLTLFGRYFDVTHYLIIVLLCAAMFAGEYGSNEKNGFAPVLRTAKKGRNPVFAAKMGSAALIAGLTGLAFGIFDLIIFLTRYGTTGLTAPLICIEQYADFSRSLTVGGYIVLYILLRLFAGILLALFVTALSGLLPSVKLNLPVIAILTLLPMALIYFGVSVCKYFDYTAFLDADRLLRFAVTTGVGSAFAAIFTFAAVAVTAGFTAISYKKFCR